jgi:hypothetical protein
VKNFIIIICIVGGAFFLRQSIQNPDVIDNPVYAENRMTIDFSNRSIESVIFIKTIDEAECKKYSKNIQDGFQKASPNLKLRWVAKSSECKSELPPRYAKLFDNVPASVAYLSVSGGGRQREIRMLTLGVSVEESDMVCDIFSKNNPFKGTATCIRTIR